MSATSAYVPITSLNEDLERGLVKEGWKMRFAYLPKMLGHERNEQTGKAVWICWQSYQSREFAIGATTLREFRLDHGSPSYFEKEIDIY